MKIGFWQGNGKKPADDEAESVLKEEVFDYMVLEILNEEWTPDQIRFDSVCRGFDGS